MMRIATLLVLSALASATARADDDAKAHYRRGLAAR
jgi:hypothetical protein